MSSTSDAQLLAQWLAVESPSHEAAAVNAMVEVVALYAAHPGIGIERLAGRDGLGDLLILRAGPDNGRRSALVIGHLDTVHPLGVVQDALPIRQEGDRLYGPGVYDMKGGVLIALQAMLAAAQAGRLQRPVVFALSPDEEIGSPTSRPVIETLAREADFALVMEPAREGGGCVTARKAVGRYKISFEGRAAHAGMRHQDGRSAILEAARQIVEIEALTDYAAGVTASVGVISGGTGVNVVPQFSCIEVDLRAPSDLLACGCDRRLYGLRAFDPDVSVKVEGGLNRPAYERNPGSIALYERARGLAEGLGMALPEAPMTGGGSDGNFTAALGVPTLDGLGIEGAGAHTLSEYGLTASIAPRRALIGALLEG
ncbi:M20 family metallopeptidase [Caulobacter segnis]|uniref:M20 family metallopeptidase n=1 Tax=Caulobacter segnis TaxID=88688 RepID=UPI00240FD16E|nr:M20 family metallopeptidase [Caulobacter segnis]MDG2522916.1 M20 family metallopeptidase [Caulobacter segnis]